MRTTNSTPTGRAGRRALTYAAITATTALASLPILASPSQAAQSPDVVGALYVASNSWTGNEILTFPRLADGSLLPPLPGVPTGGLGSGPGAIPGVGTDPLGSQGSLAVDAKNMRLFAVNAGSGSLSMFSIKSSGLNLLDTAATSDTTDTSYGHAAYPVSVAVDGDAVYVLNAESNSVAHLTVTSKTLRLDQSCDLPTPVRGFDAPYAATDTHSEQPFATEAPGQIGVSPDGKHVVVVAKEGLVETGFPAGGTAGNGQIHVFDAASDGTLTDCAEPTSYVMPVNENGNGTFPFSFAWTKGGQLLVTEVFGAGGELSSSAVQPFDLGSDGSLTPISEPMGSGQAVVCWITVSGQNVYTANFLTNNLSSYSVSNKGDLALTEATADGTDPGTLVTPTDQVLSPDGDFLYQLSSGNGTVVSFAIDSTTGQLAQIGATSDGLVPGIGEQGIAAVDF